ncbi:MarP family serine protease [Microbacterium sp. No. 7]|uniref:MarP family serine protease n=1 Tax=Microbacterium sp. No. 7 TaxID=1714373 RepID=UPI0006D10BAD|nr:MarP family serine protease [Microbacterium sp. No. 7]ALJ19804.1 colicin V production protein [Microbacterium sp. No. 7]
MFDILLVILLVVALVAGLRAGFFSAIGTVCGLIAAGLVAPWVLPFVAGLVTDRAWHGITVVGSAIVLLALGAAIGGAIGRVIRSGADKLRLKGIERLLGGVVSLVAATLVLSLTAAGIASAGIPVLSAAAASSTVLRTIDRITPAPLAEAMARLHSAVLGDTVLPTIDGLLDDGELAPAPDLGSIDTDDPALAAAAGSVARVSGIAHQCGTIASGTGFVIAEDRIVTNAHVVAGVDTPLVELPGEPARDGRVIYFDPVDDLAVIAADVDAAPLPLADALVPGDAAVVQGYPYGGPFQTVPAGVIWSGSAPIGDIYGSATADRAIYSLQAEVHPGNSGGPVLTASGAVAGVVFARDEVRADVGYAMTNDELRPVLDALDGSDDAVATGVCLAA